jgi:hypothetical protein
MVMLTIFSAERVWSVWMPYHMIRHIPKNILSIIFYLNLWMRRGEFRAEIGRDDFSSKWTIPCAITIGWYQKISDAKLERLPLQAYSPDLSLCDFWLFGMLKGNIKNRAFQTFKKNLKAFTLIWNGVIFEQLQSVFLNWMERLEWVISNGGEYYIAWH